MSDIVKGTQVTCRNLECGSAAAAFAHPLVIHRDRLFAELVHSADDEQPVGA